MAFHKATKTQAKLRLALAGLAGSGKTYSSLEIATWIAKMMRESGQGDGRIAALDTEHESASLYADRFDFDTMSLDNHSPRAYVEAIREAEKERYDILVIDSLSHAWAGKNGALEQKDSAALRSGNSWTAWRDITPMHNQLVDAMLASRMHIIATMRTKMEYIQTTTNGTTKIEKVGLAAIQREGMEYEFTIVGDMDLSNTMRISKTRLAGVLAPGEVFERPGESFARKVYGWLMSGEAPAPRSEPAAHVRQSVDDGITATLNAIDQAKSLDDLEQMIPQLKTMSGPLLNDARRRYGERKTWLQKQIVDAKEWEVSKQPEQRVAGGPEVQP